MKFPRFHIELSGVAQHSRPQKSSSSPAYYPLQYCFATPLFSTRRQFKKRVHSVLRLEFVFSFVILSALMEHIKESLSQLSNQSADSPNEDWDRSMQEDADPTTRTPRNSIAFPGATNGDDEGSPLAGGGPTKRTLSELLKVHAEKGTDVTFTPEEASRLADVLGQWVSMTHGPST